MNKTQKRKTEELILKLKKEKTLTAASFFIEARRTWGKALSTEALVIGFNEGLGRLFGRGELSFEEVQAAQKVD